MAVRYEWRGVVDNDAVNALHAEAFGQAQESVDWWTRLHRHSLGWVCAHEHDRLVGFVNVAWDGGVHAFLLDTMVAQDMRKTGVGTELVRTAVQGARDAHCAWLHADFEGHLRRFYVDACGFRPTDAGLVALR
jgi:GNAT superfamily N-acetyltransferase